MRPFINLTLCLCIQWLIAQESKNYKIHTLAFYNVENLFDPANDPYTFDDDRTPEGADRWTEERYNQKIKQLAEVIGQIGLETTGNAPILIGLAEVENRTVLQDLINSSPLAKYGYRIVHQDSPDRRGIDVALIYQSRFFRLKHAQWHPLVLYRKDEPDRRIYTRDQLVVGGYLEEEEFAIIVNHWPSRSGGEALTQPRRMAAARLNRRLIDSLQHLNPYLKITTMGDFNDDPSDKSIRKELRAKGKRDQVSDLGLYNPMAALHQQGLGTLAFRDSWNLFDQIMVSETLIQANYDSFRLFKAGIYNPNRLTYRSGRYQGYPWRTYAGGVYSGGISDHFPVYAYLIKLQD
ncbi:endonuclease/exonuclease/phosphatase family protein [Croceiramulus getboli]|nr:endonuclease/exonuclease/phosphatase family protein [Flavobacteriaceae bacterium YJPT1-3]